MGLFAVLFEIRSLHEGHEDGLVQSESMEYQKEEKCLLEKKSDVLQKFSNKSA
jgi:hypothetical protein